MFRRKVMPIGDVVNLFLREHGLESPLQEVRLLAAWDRLAAGRVGAAQGERFIRNQVLFAKIQSPALRADLSMMRTELVRKLNAEVGAFVIADIRFF